MRSQLAWLVVVLGLVTSVARAQDVAEGGPEGDTTAEEAPSDSPPVETEEQRLERARQLFGQGVDLASAGQLAEAAARFREALSIRQAPAIQYNLAAALMDMGELAEAYDLVEGVLASAETNDAMRARAQELRDDLAGRVARLSMTLAGNAEGARVTLDGEEIPTEELGRPVTVLPGAHTIATYRGGEELSRRDLEVEAGATLMLELHLVPTPGEAARIVVQEPGGERSSGAPAWLTDWRVWAGVGGAVVLIVVVAIVAASAGGTQAPLRGDFEPGVLRW